MTKLVFEPLPLAEWLELDRRAPAPTFFARPAWAIAIHRVFPNLAPWPLRCQLDNGAQAYVPLTRVLGSRLKWKIFHGMPFDGYTAVLSADGLVGATSAQEVASQLLGAGDEVLLNVWPFQALKLASADVRIAAETSAMDISGDMQAARSKMGSKSRRMAGQAQRKGATCAIESGGDAAKLYYSLLCETATERWHRASPTIREEFLREVCSNGGDAVEVWIVRYEGEPVAGGVALYGSQEVSLWTTATKPGMENLRPHNLLHASIIEHAAQRGVHWYNLNSSSGLEGVLRFKKALGADCLPYEILGHRSLRFRLLQMLPRTGRQAQGRSGA